MNDRGQPGLNVGDRISFKGASYHLTGLDSALAMLSAPGLAPIAVQVSALVSDPTFSLAVASRSRRRPLSRPRIFGALPATVQADALAMERHITEILDGIPCDAAPGTSSRAEYNVDATSLRQRTLAKHAELAAAGQSIGVSTLQRLRKDYETQGLMGLVDRRIVRGGSLAGNTDQRYVEVLLKVLEQNLHQSTGSMDRLRDQVHKAVACEYPDGQVTVPSRATFHRLVGRLREGRHATGSARTRRTLDQQPDAPFSAVYPVRPGELMQIDSTPLDVAVDFGDGVTGRVELTALIDIATRSIPAAVLQPTTKAVDAAFLLARCVTPEPMRPGWPEAVSMAASALPFKSLRSIDERLASAAAKPVIIPDTIVFDHGKAYLSYAFRTACSALGISLQPAHPDTPTDKPVVERTLQSIGTLFVQYTTGYLGSSVERRGKEAEKTAVFSMVELQDLLDEWIITHWQNRPHEGLRDPFIPSRVFTPNEKYASLVAVTGYVALPLGAEDYIELMPSRSRAINSYGIKLNYRVYDAPELNPYRGQKSGMKLLKDRWEVRYDPYDVSRVWIRNHRDGGWITAFWRRLHAGAQPFGDAVWEHGRRIVSERGITSPSEESIKEAVDQLLAKAAGTGSNPSSKKGRRILARNRATARSTPGLGPVAPTVQESPPDRQEIPDTVQEDPEQIIPLKIYDAHEKARQWW